MKEQTNPEGKIAASQFTTLLHLSGRRRSILRALARVCLRKEKTTNLKLTTAQNTKSSGGLLSTTGLNQPRYQHMKKNNTYSANEFHSAKGLGTSCWALTELQITRQINNHCPPAAAAAAPGFLCIPVNTFDSSF